MPHPEQDLATIRTIMEESRSAVVERGRHFVIWGTLPVVGLIHTYLFASGGVGIDPVWVWLGVLLVGWTASLLVGYREGRDARVATLGRRLLSGIWLSVAGSITLIALAGMFGAGLHPATLPGLLAVVLAAPTCLTAFLTGERWLYAVAAGWWVGGATMLFVPGTYALLLMAGMGLVLMALPGGVLHVRALRSAPASGAADSRT